MNNKERSSIISTHLLPVTDCHGFGDSDNFIIADFIENLPYLGYLMEMKEVL